MVRSTQLLAVLAAFGLLSVACSKDDNVPARRLSDRGQTCQSSGDCSGSLICATGQCSESTVGISPTAKQCVLNQCSAAADCCPALTGTCLTDTTLCAQDATLHATECTYVQTYCPACDATRYTCDSGTCHRAPTTCTVNLDCSMVLVADPVTGVYLDMCSTDGKCVQCLTATDCLTGQACTSGRCVAACLSDNDCQALYSCQDSRCTYKGCTEDRECKVVRANAEAYCDANKQCVTSKCASDTECFQPRTPTLIADSGNAYAYQVCISGRCQNAGCDTDDECKALLSTYLTVSARQLTPKIAAQCVAK
jgi:hypothetical protein